MKHHEPKRAHEPVIVLREITRQSLPASSGAARLSSLPGRTVRAASAGACRTGAGSVSAPAAGEVCYRLLMIGRGTSRVFAVSVSLGSEREIAFFGRDGSAALAAFRKIAAGCVTPCTLRYIAEDLRRESELCAFADDRVSKR